MNNFERPRKLLNSKPLYSEPQLSNWKTSPVTQGVRTRQRRERLTRDEPDPETGKTKRVSEWVMVDAPRWTGHQGLGSTGAGRGDFCGFAVEIGEAPDHADYDAFKKAVLTKAKLDTSKIQEGRVVYTSSTGTTLSMQWGDTLDAFQVVRNGQPHDWKEHGAYVWRETGRMEDGLIFQRWGDAGGTLHVNAGGKSFKGTVSPTGLYQFENR